MREYLTIEHSASAELVEKKSRFIGQIVQVSTEHEATGFIQSVKTKYWDATHNVSAYILKNGQIKRYSDDGEPKGTAGIPVLDVLEKEQLFDCAVVVTRYFGGTLLGTGGLVRAYSHACKLAVDAGGIVLMTPCVNAQLICDYTFYQIFLNLCEKNEIVIDNTSFEDKITLLFHLKSSDFKQFHNLILDSSLGKYKLSRIGETYAKMKRISHE